MFLVQCMARRQIRYDSTRREGAGGGGRVRPSKVLSGGRGGVGTGLGLV